MRQENRIVNGLWIGKELSNLELLTIHSFISQGHVFHLWTYNPIETELPAGTEICNAAEIIPVSSVFAYTHSNKYGHGKGSYAGFSDIFRYKLLYELGGWWVDMDVTCLKPLDFTKPYFFRKHHEMPAVGSVMSAPKGSKLMKLCYEESIATVNAASINWHQPIEILNKYIVQENLSGFVESGASNLDSWLETSSYIRTDKQIPEEWYFIHWQNEEWRVRGVNRNSFYYRSALALLMAKYQLTTLPAGYWQKWKNELRHSRLARRVNFNR